MKNNKLISIIMFLGLVVMLTMNTLAITLPLNNQSTAELSDKYESLFTPAGITFSIWSVIYVLVIIYVLSEMYKAFFKKESSNMTTINILFICSTILNSLWIVVWHYEMLLLSVVVMLALLINLIIIYLKLSEKPVVSKLISTTFSIYLGWISVAIIANISALLISINWNAFGIDPIIWTMFLILISGFLAIIFIEKYKDIAYPLVIVWANIGIFLKQLNSETIVAYASLIVIIVSITFIIKTKLKTLV